MSYSVVAKQIPRAPNHIFAITRAHLQYWLSNMVKYKGQINEAEVSFPQVKTNAKY